MNKRTRYFTVGSLAIVTVGLCTGLVAFYNGGRPNLSASQGPSELAYLPADATAVAFANVNDVMNSQFRQKLTEAMPTGEGRDKFMEETGIDIERDIDTVVASMSADEKDGVILVRGRFNVSQIESLVRRNGGDVEDYKGVRVVTGPPATSSRRMDGAGGEVPRDGVNVNIDHDGTVAFLEAGLIALGDTASVKRAIDAKESGNNVRNNDKLMAYVNDIRAGQSAWAVGRFDAVQKTTEIPDQIKQHMPEVKWFSVMAHVNGGVSGTLRADTTDDLAAENLRDVIRGGLAMGRLVSGQDEKIKILLDSLQMSGTGTTVALTFSVSSEMVDVLAGLAKLADASKN